MCFRKLSGLFVHIEHCPPDGNPRTALVLEHPYHRLHRLDDHSHRTDEFLRCRSNPEIRQGILPVPVSVRQNPRLLMDVSVSGCSAPSAFWMSNPGATNPYGMTSNGSLSFARYTRKSLSRVKTRRSLRVSAVAIREASAKSMGVS